MKNYSVTGFVLLLVLFVTGCSNEKLPAEIPESNGASYKDGPAFLKYAGTSQGPLFDLVTTPNGDLLIADVGVGVVDYYGNVVAALPGTSSIDLVGNGNMWAVTWPTGDPMQDNGQALYRVHKNRVEMVANLYAYEEENNPHDTHIESNPYGVAALNGNKALVVDAAGNDLLRIDQKGNIELLAVFPDELVSTENVKSLVGCPESEHDLCQLPDRIPAEAVPTTVVVGPDGYYYVGELKGFPAPIGESNIWKISPDASGAMCGSSPDCVKAFDGGFTSIIDMVFSKDGLLYVAEMDANGWLAAEFRAGAGGTIKVCDPETLQCEVVATGIPLLTAITIDKDGNLWATQNALIPGMAEVIKIAL